MSIFKCYDPVFQSPAFILLSQYYPHVYHYFRVKYEILKEVCKKMFPLIGSGKIVTAPIITEDGKPNQDPTVLQQIYGNKTMELYLIKIPIKA